MSPSHRCILPTPSSSRSTSTSISNRGHFDRKSWLPPSALALTCCATGFRMFSIILVWKTGILVEYMPTFPKCVSYPRVLIPQKSLFFSAINPIGLSAPVHSGCPTSPQASFSDYTRRHSFADIYVSRMGFPIYVQRIYFCTAQFTFRWMKCCMIMPVVF